METGALNLASPEVKIHLDSSESPDPIDVEQKELKEPNSLVEEFMLLACCEEHRRSVSADCRFEVCVTHVRALLIHDNILIRRYNLLLELISRNYRAFY